MTWQRAFTFLRLGSLHFDSCVGHWMLHRHVAFPKLQGGVCLEYRDCRLQPRMMSSSSQSDRNLQEELSPWRQGFYKYFLPIQTRIRDTDWFGHVNNVVYNAYMDTVVNHYLIRHCGLQHLRKDSEKPNIVGFMVDTRCTFKAPFNYPEVALASMAVTKLGNSSVTYTIGIFSEEPGADGGGDQHRLPSIYGDVIELDQIANFKSHQNTACAIGQCVHVFVDLNGDQRPVRIPDSFRIPFKKVHIPYESSISKL